MNAVLGTNATNRRRNVRIPTARHAGKQVVFHLKVEAARQVSRNGPTVRARRFYLRLEPADGFARLAHIRGGIAIGSLKVVRETKQDGQTKTLDCSHEHDIAKSSPAESMVQKGRHNIDANVQETQGNGKLAATLDKVRLHLNANTQGTTLSQVQYLWVEHGREPVASQDRKVVKDLKAVVPLTRRMVQRIVVEQHHGLGTKRVGVVLCVVRVRMVRPVLFLPEPLGTADKVCSQTKQVIDPGFLAASAMIGVMLNVHTNQGLGDTVDKRQLPRRSLRHPQVLQIKEEGYIANGTKVPTIRAKLATATDNLEDFRLDLTLKGRVKFVSETTTGKTTLRCQ